MACASEANIVKGFASYHLRQDRPSAEGSLVHLGDSSQTIGTGDEHFVQTSALQAAQKGRGTRIQSVQQESQDDSALELFHVSATFIGSLYVWDQARVC